MHRVNVREARESISRLLTEVERGEEIIISRHGSIYDSSGVRPESSD